MTNTSRSSRHGYQSQHAADGSVADQRSLTELANDELYLAVGETLRRRHLLKKNFNDRETKAQFLKAVHHLHTRPEFQGRPAAQIDKCLLSYVRSFKKNTRSKDTRSKDTRSKDTRSKDTRSKRGNEGDRNVAKSTESLPLSPSKKNTEDTTAGLTITIGQGIIEELRKESVGWKLLLEDDNSTSMHAGKENTDKTLPNDTLTPQFKLTWTDQRGTWTYILRSEGAPLEIHHKAISAPTDPITTTGEPEPPSPSPSPSPSQPGASTQPTTIHNIADTLDVSTKTKIRMKRERAVSGATSTRKTLRR